MASERNGLKYGKEIKRNDLPHSTSFRNTTRRAGMNVHHRPEPSNSQLRPRTQQQASLRQPQATTTMAWPPRFAFCLILSITTPTTQSRSNTCQQISLKWVEAF